MTVNSDDIIHSDFETLYIRLREKEGRIYTDEQVAALPVIDEQHPHFREWSSRKESSSRLIDYLGKMNRPEDILEIGCGNGWLSHRLAGLPRSRVIATDINFTEVQQAARVFQHVPNLHFIYGEAVPSLFADRRFDTIVFASSIQYFGHIRELLRNTLKLLKPGGEIHIIDSHFYPLHEISAARQRSWLHFEAAGVPEMANWYFHHSLEDLEEFNYSILYDPNGIFNRFLRNKNPFYWMRIQP